MKSPLKLVKKFDNLKIIILRSPYDIWDFPRVGDLFVKMVGLKLSGYVTRHRYGVMPLDTSDFISTHILVGMPRPDGIEVISAFKTITEEKCRLHNIPFVGIQVARGSGALQHVKALEALIEECRKEKRQLSYASSWTISAPVRKDREFAIALRDVITALFVRIHKGDGISDIVACGAPVVKSDELIRAIGFQNLRFEGQELPAFSQASLLGETAVMMHSNAFSAAALEIADRLQNLWAQRIVIENSEDLKRVA